MDAQRGYQLAAGAVGPPLLLDDEEAVAFALGLQSAAQGAVTGIEEASLRALAKLAQVMPPQLRRRGRRSALGHRGGGVGQRTTVDAGVLTTVAQTCRDEERIRFVYTAHAGQQTARHVEPHRLVCLGRRWYLVAFDVTRQDWRTFRLDRVEKPSSTAVGFTPRALPAEDAAACVRASVGGAAAPSHIIEVVVSAPSDKVRPMLRQWATIEDIDELSCRLRMTPTIWTGRPSP